MSNRHEEISELARAFGLRCRELFAAQGVDASGFHEQALSRIFDGLGNDNPAFRMFISIDGRCFCHTDELNDLASAIAKEMDVDIWDAMRPPYRSAVFKREWTSALTGKPA